MSTDSPAIDDIARRLREEDARLRRRTLLLSLLPVLIGTVVLALAWAGVERARGEKRALEDQQARLDQRIQSQQGEIDALEQQRAALDRDIAARQDLLEQAVRRLPAGERAEVVELQAGIAQQRSGDHRAAIQRYDQAIARDDGNALPYRLRGQAQYEAAQYAAAVDSLRAALERDPKDAQARYVLGLSLAALGRTDDAIVEIERAFTNGEVKARALQDPAFKPLRAEIDSRGGRDSSRSADEQAWVERGLQSARRGEFAAAAEAYGRALAIRPDNARVLNWQGYALYRDGQLDAAVKSFERAAALEPGKAEIHYNLALTLWKGGQADAAKRAILRAYEVDPAYPAVAQRDPQSKALRAALLTPAGS